MHQIQQHILRQLSLSPTARFSELKPKNTEGNLFMYHLKSLLRNRLIEQTNKVYRLSSKGRHYVDRVSFETFRERIQPKIVTLLIIKNKAGQYLFYRRRRVPFINMIGFPYGKIHLEERVAEAAERELTEKTGITAKLKYHGDVYLTIHNETELISHMLCHIFTGQEPQGKLQTDSTIGECFWSKFEEQKANELMPGVKQIVRLLKDKHHQGNFFEEYFLNVGDES